MSPSRNMKRDPPLNERCQASAKRAPYAPTHRSSQTAAAQNMVRTTQKNGLTFRQAVYRGDCLLRDAYVRVPRNPVADRARAAGKTDEAVDQLALLEQAQSRNP